MFAHVRERAAERYGLDVGPDDYERMLRTVRLHRRTGGCLAVTVYVPPGFLPRYSVRHNGVWLAVVYDPRRDTLVTVLPASVLRESSDFRIRFLEMLREQERAA